jgi:hypothetical protein
MSADYNSVEDALQAAADDGGFMLERVLREERGEPAVPAPTDYVVALRATDGAVALELDLPQDGEQVAFRYNDGESEFERYADFDGSEPSVTTVESIVISKWTGQFGCSLILADAVAEEFEETQSSTPPKAYRGP